MQQRIIIVISGIGLLYLGLKVLITGSHYVKGVHSYYAYLKTPVGILFLVFGVICIVTALPRNKDKP